MIERPEINSYFIHIHLIISLSCYIIDTVLGKMTRNKPTQSRANQWPVLEMSTRAFLWNTSRLNTPSLKKMRVCIQKCRNMCTTKPLNIDLDFYFSYRYVYYNLVHGLRIYIHTIMYVCTELHFVLFLNCF